MLSVNQMIKSKLNNRAYMLESIEQGYANLSQIARILKGEIEEETGEQVDLEAAKTAVRRFADKASEKKKEREGKIKEVLKGSKLEIKDNLAIVFSDTKLDLKDVLAFSDTPSENYMYLVDEDSVEDENNVERGLAALLLITPGIEDVPGATAYILKSVAEEGINITALMGVGQDNIFVIKEEDVPETYGILKNICS